MKGTVKKDQNGWYYVIDVGTNGKSKQQKRRFNTEKEAEEALLEVNHQLNKGIFQEPSKTLYKDYLDEWFLPNKIVLAFKQLRYIKVIFVERLFQHLETILYQN